MWFGDLVTMQWFNDVWMKEVFANHMAAKIVNPAFPAVNHDLRYLVDYYPSGYGVDRTAGTNEIRQPLENLNEAGTLYGAIIYQKAPIVMRQLETLVGSDGFRDGLREYLKTSRVRQRLVAGPDCAAGRPHARRSGGLEPRLGRGARPPGHHDRADAVGRQDPQAGLHAARSLSAAAACSGTSGSRSPSAAARSTLLPVQLNAARVEVAGGARTAGAVRPAERRRHRLRRVPPRSRAAWRG